MCSLAGRAEGGAVRDAVLFEFVHVLLQRVVSPLPAVQADSSVASVEFADYPGWASLPPQSSAISAQNAVAARS